jgi:hypothetical protein
MIRAGLEEQLEGLVGNLQGVAYRTGEVSSPLTVGRIRGVRLAAAIVQKGEGLDDLRIGANVPSQIDAVLANPLPM